jgi:hypothetical protein
MLDSVNSFVAQASVGSRPSGLECTDMQVVDPCRFELPRSWVVYSSTSKMALQLFASSKRALGVSKRFRIATEAFSVATGCRERHPTAVSDVPHRPTDGIWRCCLIADLLSSFTSPQSHRPVPTPSPTPADCPRPSAFAAGFTDFILRSFVFLLERYGLAVKLSLIHRICGCITFEMLW